MNLTNFYDNYIDEIPINHIIFTGKKIYKKLLNLDGSYNLMNLVNENNYVRWEKVYNFNNNEHRCASYIYDFNDNKYMSIYSYEEKYLSYTNEKTNNMESFLMIYRVDDNNSLVETLEYYDNNNYIKWKNDKDIHLVNKYVTSKPFSEISTHIDLTKEYNNCDNYYDNNTVIDDNLDGWDLGDYNYDEIEIKEKEDLNSEKEDLNSEKEDLNNEKGNVDTTNSSYYLEDIFEECRVDPYDNLWYTKSEFFEYYGGLIEWDHQHPKKVLLREEYNNFAENYSHLSNKKFKYLFKKFQKTFD